MVNILENLIGKTITAIEDNKTELKFVDNENNLYRFYHAQDCCEDVKIEEVIGNYEDLIGRPLTMAEEVTYDNEMPEEIPAKKDKYGSYYHGDSFTWTFYKFATVKGYVTVRWLGTSNGYYSEAVNLEIKCLTQN
ncbi:MAG TPA: hypothetical protein PLP33_25925 [Leptospiraceae bacterium]|nr:hypothetical protein [Leptospiraceae bacterium]